MRRLLSLVLLAAFGLPVVAPALAMGQDTEGSLPACCRRNGAHHCSMNMHRAPSSAPAFSEHCPNFPQPSTTPAQTSAAVIAFAQQTAVVEFFALNSLQHVETQRLISLARSHQKRGPPTVLLT